MDIDLREVIEHIPCSSLEYQEWVNIGMALKFEGYPCEAWESWSRADNRYKQGECQKKWNTFNGASSPVTAGTIVQMAKEFGWDPKKEVRVFDWDDEIGVDKYDTAWVEAEPIEPDKDEKIDSYSEIVRYINTLFKTDDHVSIVNTSYEDQDGKFKPGSKGITRTAGEWLADLEKHKKDIMAAIGDCDERAGAWIRFNPMDGAGVKNENVKQYKYALVESDNVDISMQNALIREMKLPVAILVYSGGKSLHAIVKVDAPDYETYKQRVEKLYAVCDRYGLKVDRQNKNPSRLSRLPGIKRKDKWQRIIDSNIGLVSYDAWETWIDDEMDEYPDPEDMFKGEKLPLPDELIGGILRQGGKMSLTGPSKAGKSFLLMELAIAIATGSDWLGHKCAAKKVLYINFEIDKASMQDRYWHICEALGIDRSSLSGILDTWNMKGHSAPIQTLKKSLIRRCLKGGYGVVILDPIYKTLMGDENSATDMSKFTAIFDAICNETGVSIVYAHHHSKGSQGGKSAADRSSGSGVFARDPNAIVDMLEIRAEDADGVPVEIPYNSTAWRIEATLRDFATPQPFEMVFDYPVHKLWTGLSDAREMYGGKETRRDKQEKGRETIQKRKNKNDHDLVAYIAQFVKDTGHNPTLQDAANELGKGFSISTLKQKAKDIDGLQIANGMLFYTEPMDYDDDI